MKAGNGERPRVATAALVNEIDFIAAMSAAEVQAELQRLGMEPITHLPGEVKRLLRTVPHSSPVALPNRGSQLLFWNFNDFFAAWNVYPFSLASALFVLICTAILSSLYPKPPSKLVSGFGTPVATIDGTSGSAVFPSREVANQMEAGIGPVDRLSGKRQRQVKGAPLLHGFRERTVQSREFVRRVDVVPKMKMNAGRSCSKCAEELSRSHNPFTTDRKVTNVALSAPGVSQVERVSDGLSWPGVRFYVRSSSIKDTELNAVGKAAQTSTPTGNAKPSTASAEYGIHFISRIDDWKVTGGRVIARSTKSHHPVFLVATSNGARSNVATSNVVATAYSLRGRTASGRMVGRGLIAADPRVLPLGSRVRLEHPGYSGDYLVADTGGLIRGKRIDIWTPSSSEAMRFGRRTVKLTVLSYAAKLSR